jgi:hypothetical protein
VDWIHLAQGRAGDHEYGNRLLVFIKGAEFLDQISDISFSRLWFQAVGYLNNIFSKIQDNYDINSNHTSYYLVSLYIKM